MPRLDKITQLRTFSFFNAICSNSCPHPGQMEENVDHFLLLECRLEHLFGVAEHPETVVALAHLELPEPVLVLGLLERLK